MGPAIQIDELTIYWLDGAVEKHQNIKSDRLVTLTLESKALALGIYFLWSPKLNGSERQECCQDGGAAKLKDCGIVPSARLGWPTNHDVKKKWQKRLETQ